MSALFLLVPLFILVIFVIIAVLVIAALVRRVPPRTVLAPPRVDVITRLGPDGFWLEACPADPGARVHFHYWSAGIRHAGQVPYTPDASGRQFVYTGLTPEQVVILRIVEGVEVIDYGMVPPLIDVGVEVALSGPPDFLEAPAPPASYPPAY